MDPSVDYGKIKINSTFISFTARLLKRMRRLLTKDQIPSSSDLFQYAIMDKMLHTFFRLKMVCRRKQGRNGIALSPLSSINPGEIFSIPANQNYCFRNFGTLMAALLNVDCLFVKDKCIQ